jgi:hypothetical protein
MVPGFTDLMFQPSVAPARWIALPTSSVLGLAFDAMTGAFMTL